MSTSKKKSIRQTIKDVEKTYKTTFSVSGRMNLSTYLKKQGLPSLGRFLEKIEAQAL